MGHIQRTAEEAVREVLVQMADTHAVSAVILFV